ncbi:MAG: phage tail tape measure protein [Kiritimatiellales bacterium]
MAELGVSLKLNLVDRLTGGMKRVEETVGRVSAAFKKQADELKKVEASLEKYQKRMQLAQNLTIVGGQVSATGNKLLRPIKNAVDVAAQFEESMSAVKAVTGATADQFAALERQARQLGSSTQFTAIQAAEGMKFLGMAGFKTSEILEAMPSMLALAKSGSLDLGRAADVASNILSGFGLEATEMTRVADVMAAAFTNSNTDINMLGDSMKYVAPLANAAGMSLEEAAAMAGMLGDAGIQGSMAGTALRAMLQKLANPASDAAALLSEFNIDLLDMEGNLRSPVAILGELAEAMEGLGSGELLKNMSTLFDDRAAAGMTKLMADEGSGGITKFVKALENSAGAAKRIEKQMGDNTKGSIIELMSAVEGLQIAFGSLSFGPLRVVTDLITKFTQKITALTEKNTWWAKVILYGVGALGLLLATLGGLMGVVASILGPIAMMNHAMVLSQVYGVSAGSALRIFGSAVLGATKRVFAFGLTLVKSALVGLWSFITAIPAMVSGLGAIAVAGWTAMAPFLPIIAIIAAVAGAAFLIVKFWEPIKGFFQQLWAGIISGAQMLWNVIKTVFGFSPLGLILKAWNPIINFFKGVWDKIGGVLSRLGSFFGFGAKGAAAGAMAGVAVAGTPNSTLEQNYVPLEKTITEARANNTSSSVVSAPITINPAPGQSPEDIAAAVARELDARDRRVRSGERGGLYDSEF